MDGFGEDFDWRPPAHVRLQRLRERAFIRKHNDERPRCAGCRCDMPVFNLERDLITAEQLKLPGYDYLLQSDFRAGDLVCFWCIHGITEVGDRYQWGHA